MMEPLIALLVNLLVLVLVLVLVMWIAQLAIEGLKAPPIALTIVKAICALILLLWLLNVLVGSAPPRIWGR